jgi:hypothetical protein
MFGAIFQEAAVNSLKTMFQIALIIIPVMVVIRLAKEAEILNKVSTYFESWTSKIYLSKEATFPLIVGIVFGLTYGAGVIIQSVREGRLSQRDMVLINVFLGLNHAIIEDTLLFYALGANPWVMLVTRTIIAVLATYVIGRWLVHKERLGWGEGGPLGES